MSVLATETRSAEVVREMRYTVMLRPEPEGGFTVLIPALPGCISYGETVEEALAAAEEAMICHLGALKAMGKRAPKEGEILKLPAAEVTGTLLVYRLNIKPERAAVA
ncbi:MAG: type II toxin-antitoxin system HicB family antitoxin [Armatimonadia bacterium]